MKFWCTGTTWIDFESIMLSKIAQTRGTNTVCFTLYEVSWLCKFINTEVDQRLPGMGRGALGEQGVV